MHTLGLIDGPRFLLRGFGLLLSPGVKRFVVLPALVNIVLFAAGYWLLATTLSGWVEQWLPDWLDWLSWLIWPLLALAFAFVGFFCFTLLANLLLAPFNGVLAARIARTIGHAPPPVSETGSNAWADVRDELRRLAYALVWALAPLAISFAPVVNLAAPLAWFVYGAWMLGFEYLGPSLANAGLRFSAQLECMRASRPVVIGFGASAALATMIPVVNFLVLPAALAGGTALAVRLLEDARRA